MKWLQHALSTFKHLILWDVALLVGLRIRQQYFLQRNKSLQNESTGHDTKLYQVVRLQFWSSGEFVVSLLPGPLWLGVVVSVREPFLGQIDMFENYKYGREMLETILPYENKRLLYNRNSYRFWRHIRRTFFFTKIYFKILPRLICHM